MSTIERATDPVELADETPPPRLRMTEEEFVAWCKEDVRAEWVDGEVIIMSPASYRHVAIEAFLIRVLGEFVEHFDLGEVLGVEFMIRLPEQRRRRMPDILFVSEARRHLIRKNHLEGAPDLAIEVVSPDSVSRDWREKYLEYQAAGVREYWVIDPLPQLLEAYALGADGLYHRIEEVEGRVASVLLPGFFLRPPWLWQERLPRVRDVLRELGVAQ
jgi:Uma2 family endonuclease